MDRKRKVLNLVLWCEYGNDGLESIF